MSDRVAGLNERRWRRNETRRLADRAAFWAWQAENDRDVKTSDEKRRMAFMFAAAAQAMKGS